MSVEQASLTLLELQAKHTAAIARATELAAERRRIAFAGHTGDAKARAKLDAINAEVATLASEIEGLAAAVDEAGTRLRNAHAEVERQARAVAAAEAAAIGDRLRQRGEEIGNAFKIIRDAHAWAMDDIGRLQSLGFSVPSFHNARVYSQLALRSELFGTAIQIEHLAPHERHGFAEVFNNWAERLGSLTPATAEKAAA